MQPFIFQSVDSTNEVAKRLIQQEQVHDLAFVMAKEQTAGKGTRGRTWVSPPGAGMYLSVIHVDKYFVLPLTPLFTLAAGVACAEHLQKNFGLEIQLKPINDLYANRCKLGGILTESIIQVNTVNALITGIGINILDCRREMPENSEIQPVALENCIKSELIQNLNMENFAHALAEEVHDWYQHIFYGDPEAVVKRWKDYQLPGTECPV